MRYFNKSQSVCQSLATLYVYCVLSGYVFLSPSYDECNNGRLRHQYYIPYHQTLFFHYVYHCFFYFWDNEKTTLSNTASVQITIHNLVRYCTHDPPAVCFFWFSWDIATAIRVCAWSTQQLHSAAHSNHWYDNDNDTLNITHAHSTYIPCNLIMTYAHVPVVKHSKRARAHNYAEPVQPLPIKHTDKGVKYNNCVLPRCAIISGHTKVRTHRCVIKPSTNHTCNHVQPHTICMVCIVYCRLADTVSELWCSSDALKR